ncbi:hypothetical protein ANO11243_040980 [Dothideomycetidae sp. 11243]|nr:hypothetical protein ANO11243_040980 [fungal sp. No.11243]
MDGRNSSGRTVSLLNDYCDAAPPALLAPLAASRSSAAAPSKLPALVAITKALSESPSEASTPSLSPQTPPLIRSESSDSRAFASPSPLTPQSSSFDGAQQLGASKQGQSYYLYRQPWSKMDDPTLYPALPEAATMAGFTLPPMSTGPMPAIPGPQVRSSDSPVSDSRVSNVSNASASAAAQKQNAKKSQYPCPLAKQYKCNDFFTTSGHAARHAKKHTGRKDAICPECNKAFTRKDNMEQHRRTHQNVRGPTSSKATDSRVKKPVKQNSRRSDRSSISAPLEAAAVAQLEEQAQQQLPPTNDFPTLANSHMLQPGLLAGGGPYYMNPEPVGSLPQPIVSDYTTRPQMYRSGYNGSLDFTSAITPSLGDPADLHFNYPSPGLSNGLNTLALAASDHRRMSEEASSSKSSSNTP